MRTALLGRLPADRPVIQLISRFHTVVECLGRWVLATLRTFEQERRLRSINLTPLPYDELMRRWEERTRTAFTVSNYGNGHATETVAPLHIDEIRTRTDAAGVPWGIGKRAAELTGGYPEAFLEVVTTWQRLEKPEL